MPGPGPTRREKPAQAPTSGSSRTGRTSIAPGPAASCSSPATREGAVEVLGLDNNEAAEEVFAVDKRSVGQQRLTLFVAHRRRGLDVLKAEPAGHVRSRQNLSNPAVICRRSSAGVRSRTSMSS